MADTDRGFLSDNAAGAHPAVLAVLARVNAGHAAGYGEDPYTEAAVSRIAGLFGGKAEVFFVYNGTAANVLSLAAMVKPHEAVICTAMAHLNVHECGAPERFIGCKLLTVDKPDGKLTPADIESCLAGLGDEHMVQPAAVSLTQATEVGTVYTAAEIRAITALAHSRGLKVHIDGARLANAAAHLDMPLAAFTAEAGVDVVSFGAAKNGILFGEAVVLLDPACAEGFKYTRKQGMQLHSKMRFIAAQFDAMLDDDLWLANAAHANRMAQRLGKALQAIEGVTLAYPVESNGVFAVFPGACIAPLQAQFPFHVWDAAQSVVRLMCAFDTTEDDLDRLAEAVRRETVSTSSR